MSDQERRIVVEICAHAEVERLRHELKVQDDNHRAEIARLEKRLEALHRTFYEFLESMSRKKKG